MASNQNAAPASNAEISNSTPQAPTRRKPVPVVSTFEEDIEAYERLSAIKVKPLVLATDIFLCLTPISFLILAGMALSLDGKQLSGFGRNIERWSLLSPSIFPLVFSAVVGRALQFLARYKLEQGASLGVLEQLMGSQTVFGAIWTQWILRSLNLLGVVLVALWLVSPLGGQASLRLLSEVDDVHQGSSTFAYINMTVPTDERAQGQSPKAQSQTDAIYKACLVAPLSTKNGSQDTWGNVKMPNFGTYNSSLDGAGYATIPDVDVDWVSLVGLPVAGLQPNVNSTFNMTFLYHDLSCSPVYKRPANSSWLKDILNVTNLNAVNFWNLFDSESNSSQTTTWMLWGIQDSTDGLVIQKNDILDFFWLSKSGFVASEAHLKQLDYNETCIARCSLSAHNVDAEVQCSGRSCRVARIKKNRVPDTSSELTQTSLAGWGFFYPPWIKTDIQSSIIASSVTEQYIYGRTESPFYYGTRLDDIVTEYVDMSTVSQANFTQHLRTLLNTYKIASLAPAISTSALTNVNVADLLSGKQQYSGGSFPLNFIPTSAEVKSSVKVYRCNKAFFALSVISSTVLLLMGFIGTVAKYCCKGPDMFGYVTSIARHNTYTPLPAAQGVRDTDEIARLSKSVVLRLEDIRNGIGDIGHIAMSSLQMRSIQLAWKESPNRRYR